MMTLELTDEVPFKHVYMHGLVRDNDGNKMSKSRGNVLDPLDLIDGIDLESLVEKRTTGLMQPQMAKRIEKQTRKEFPEGINAYGTDALRFTFLSLATTGRDIKWDMGRIEGYRNFCNKIWNAARYVLQNTEGQDNSGEMTFSVADKWIQSELQKTIQQVTQSLEGYRLDQATAAAYDMIWHQYCDWYLELSKPVLYSDQYDEATKRGTRYTLLSVLETLLRLAHPFMPFITEEIWQRVAPLAGVAGDTIMLADYPVAHSNLIDAEATADIEWLQQMITAIRNIRAEMNIAPGRELEVLLHNASAKDADNVGRLSGLLGRLARLSDIRLLAEDEAAPPSATQLVGRMELLVPMAGLIDKDAELERLGREIQRLEKEVARAEGKLGNANFVDRAPAEVVEKEKEKLLGYKSDLAHYREQQEKIKHL